MRKVLFFIVINLLVLPIKALTFEQSLSCPESALAGSEVACEISVTASGESICSFDILYSLDNITYKKFEAVLQDFSILNSKITYNSASNNCFGGTKKIGNIYFTMPTSGIAKITLTNESKASDSIGDNYYAEEVIEEISAREASVNNNLKSLTVQGFYLVKNDDNYTLTVEDTVSSVIISAEAEDSNAKIDGIGQKNLVYGQNTFEVKVTSESGSVKKYTIIITRIDNRENINTLNKLEISSGTLSPSFKYYTLNYTVEVESDIDKIKVTASKDGSKSEFVGGYGSREISLKYGEQTIQIKVISEKGDVRTYSILVRRKDDRSDNNYLKSLVVDKDKYNINFDKEKINYSFSVNYSVDKINIEAETENEASTLTGIGIKELNVGLNTLNIVVTSEKGDTKIYTLQVTRLTEEESKSSNTNLKSLEIDEYNLDFNNDKNEYKIVVDEYTYKLNIKYTPEDENAIVKIDGNENLQNNSIISLLITATDGTTRTIKIIIEKNIDKYKFLDIKAITSIICSILMCVFVFLIVNIKKK